MEMLNYLLYVYGELQMGTVDYYDAVRFAQLYPTCDIVDAETHEVLMTTYNTGKAFYKFEKV